MDLEEEAPLQVEAVAAVDLSPAATKVDADTSINRKRPRSCVNNQLKLNLMAKNFITLLGLLIVFHPVRAINVPDSILGIPVVGMESNLEYYPRLSHRARRIAKMRSPFTMSRVGLRVLEKQTGPAKPPPAWLYNKIVDKQDEVVFLIRSDNLYICGYINPVGGDAEGVIHTFTECSHMFPKSIHLGFGGSYRDLNGGRANLTKLDLSKRTMKKALKILSRYKHKKSDLFEMRTALTRYSLVLCEAQRFTEIDECLVKGWESRCNIRRAKELLVTWSTLSCGVLEGWKPTLKFGATNYNERLWDYRNALMKLRTTREEAPSLLRLLIIGKKCNESIMGWGNAP